MVEVLVCGSAVVDLVFEVDAFPAKPEKFRARDSRIVGGGCAGNAAVGIARLGGRARLVARCAEDLIGDQMLEGLRAEGVDLDLVQRTSAGRSAYSSILVDATGDRQIVAFRGRGLAETISPDQLPKVDAVLADTRWPEAAEVALTHARTTGCPGVLDAEEPVPENLIALASHTAFSAQGLRAFTGKEGLEAGLRAAATRTTGGWLCVTDGAAGVLALSGGELHHIPTPQVEVVDTLGAGDIWHGAFALRLGEGANEIEAARFANAAAALKCTRKGGRSGAPDRKETEEFMQRNAT